MTRHSSASISTLKLEDFVPDQPKSIARASEQGSAIEQGSLIEGVKIELLNTGTDHRGMLHELLTTRDGDIEPIVHVYQVVAEPNSVRAWVYH
jgi:dTDP-4-dehydrorhamnose 3,5-epimerase